MITLNRRELTRLIETERSSRRRAQLEAERDSLETREEALEKVLKAMLDNIDDWAVVGAAMRNLCIEGRRVLDDVG